MTFAKTPVILAERENGLPMLDSAAAEGFDAGVIFRRSGPRPNSRSGFVGPPLMLSSVAMARSFAQRHADAAERRCLIRNQRLHPMNGMPP